MESTLYAIFTLVDEIRYVRTFHEVISISSALP